MKIGVINLKATAIAHSNTALIKYWGKKDEQLILPMNNSISLTTDALTTITTVEFSKDFEEDLFILDNKEQAGKPKNRVINHLNLIRELAKRNFKAKVVSENNFPTAAGLASSASGFAALTTATCAALDLNFDKKELSIISRQGSGSSCRSFYGGYVEWLAGDSHESSYSIQLAKKDWFDIRDIILVLKSPERKLSTREAMRRSIKTSPFFATRLHSTSKNLEKMREAIQERDFQLLGETTEKDCLSMHAVAMTSNPSQIFWAPDTLRIIHEVEQMREDDILAYYTIDTGANMHVLTLPEFEETVITTLKTNVPQMVDVISSKPGKGVSLIEEHLF
ncbi:MAG: diphosphomevalonate decarboxylase [Candidatus Heimdallarchaeota archaeon]|nr:diphosphomevalonate decarboxylase [Candidatus Heimdallarchaeota archaeon]